MRPPTIAAWQGQCLFKAFHRGIAIAHAVQAFAIHHQDLAAVFGFQLLRVLLRKINVLQSCIAILQLRIRPRQLSVDKTVVGIEVARGLQSGDGVTVAPQAIERVGQRKVKRNIVGREGNR